MRSLIDWRMSPFARFSETLSGLTGASIGRQLGAVAKCGQRPVSSFAEISDVER